MASEEGGGGLCTCVANCGDSKSTPGQTVWCGVFFRFALREERKKKKKKKKQRGKKKKGGGERGENDDGFRFKVLRDLYISMALTG